METGTDFPYLTEGQRETLARLTEKLKRNIWLAEHNPNSAGSPTLQRQDLRAWSSQVLGWEMGSGKTRVALAYLDAFGEIAGQFRAPHLILAPANVIPFWVEEARAIGTRTRLITPGSRAEEVRKAVERATPDDAIVISYDTLRLHVVDGGLISHTFGVVVADEAHALQSPSAKRTRMARLLDCAVFLAVTGTPYTSNPLQLMGLARTLIPSLKSWDPLMPQPHAGLTDPYSFRNSYLTKALR
ncbi:MAG: SNF2-related protein, partial [Anaerolineae bacterium]